MTKYALDWAADKVHVLKIDDDDDQPTTYPHLNIFLDTLTEPSTIILETTFESFNLETRRQIVNKAQELGHTLLCTPNRYTGRKRREMGYSDADKTDEVDVKVIKQIAKDGIVHLKTPSFADPVFENIRNKAQHELMILRSTRIPRRKSDGSWFKSMKSLKDAWAATLITKLPDYSGIAHKEYLGNGSEYSPLVVAAIGICARHVRSRIYFERLAGIYHHGYGSQIRSDLHLHGFWKRLDKECRDDKVYRKEQMKGYRRAWRWLFQELKKIVDTVPFPLD